MKSHSFFANMKIYLAYFVQKLIDKNKNEEENITTHKNVDLFISESFILKILIENKIVAYSL